MQDDTNPRARAIGALAELLLPVASDAADFAAFESAAIDAGHACVAEAMALALEARDAQLMAKRPRSLKCHDVRRRVLATEVGDVSFSIRRYRDEAGCDACLLADELDLPCGARVSPGAAGFLAEAGTHVSYAKAARLLARHGSGVRPTTVMRCLREAGELCAEEDAGDARSLYADGVLPGGQEAACELCVEADGTWFSTQAAPEGAPRRLEVKAMVAYAGKSADSGRVRRRGCVRHALVGPAGELWPEAVAVVGATYNLSGVERVHLGGDGEAWCADLERWMPKASVSFHLDPFHVNRAVLSCFPDPKAAWSVLDVLNGGDKAEAINLLKACADMGLARPERARQVAAYLEGHIDSIAVDGPSLGTMESENQHLYGVRMDSFPCAWSVRGASDMARLISRRESGRRAPRMTRERSMGAARRARRERKELAHLERRGLPASKVVQSVGSGYLPPHQVDTSRIEAGKAHALYEGMAKLG